MIGLLASLPGDIPGLLWRGSPCRIDKWADYCAVGAPDNGAVRLAAARGARIDSFGVAMVYLDLTDPTGRWNAAVWAERAPTYADTMEVLRRREHTFYVAAIDAVCSAKAGQPMTPEQIDTLARLVLRLAGRTP
jgi:hypothetical protein